MLEDIDKIPFYKERTIGERMTAALDFLRDNWVVMFRSAIYMLLPLSIVQSVAINSFFGNYINLFLVGVDSMGVGNELGIILRLLRSYGIIIVCLFIGSIILQAFAFTMVQEYNEREEGIEGVTLGMVWNRMWHNMKRVMKSTMLMMVAVIIFGAFSLLNPIGLILFIPVIVAMSVSMQMFPCIYSFEDINIKNAALRSIRLGFGTWGGLFIINLVVGFVMNIIEQVVAVPWSIALALVSIFTYIDETPQWIMVTVRVLSFLFGVLMMFVTYIAMIIQPLATAYHYAHATERKDSITVDSDIDNFENLE
ncbi:hypothetical protein [Prevotella sp. OH937_COT-195]|uniref:hypothetical protein n=1 Tax=Prevotella sp. OH937_COT-195 TaxID=2491051 RepID=UPI000F64D5FD|nr:hypothetical protein [Prevotella sp. OH937_COT-195]RRD02923.1 hypothetical protein EII32_00225 [Prevotella sp. OH937_COT-195]